LRERFVEIDARGVVLGRARDAERASTAAFDERLQTAAFLAEPFDDAERRESGEIGERFDAPAHKGVEHIERSRQNIDGQRAKDFDLRGRFDDGDATDVARGEHGGVGVRGDGDREFETARGGFALDGFADVGVGAEEAFEAIDGDEGDVLRGPFEVRREHAGDVQKRIDGTALYGEAGVHLLGPCVEDCGSGGDLHGLALADRDVGAFKERAGPEGAVAFEGDLQRRGLAEERGVGGDE